jgi:DNA-binding HxlR family transcriptional regulator
MDGDDQSTDTGTPRSRADGPEATSAEARRLRAASPAGRRLFTLLSRSGALETLSEVGVADPEPVRFGELRDRLDLSSATLSARLSELVDAGLLERTSYDEIPPRVEYTATERLADLKPVFGHLVDWAGRHGFEASADEHDAAVAGDPDASDPDDGW